MVGRLLGYANALYGPEWPPELSEILAKLVLGRMITSPSERVASGSFATFQNDFLFTPELAGRDGMAGGIGDMSGNPDLVAPNYDKNTISKLRESHRHFLTAWVNVVNEYLTVHPDLQAVPGNIEIIRSIETASRVYFDTDDWDMETTAKLWTEILRRHYDARLMGVGEPMNAETINWMPAIVLDPIVRITGGLPDFVRNGRPPSEAVLRINPLDPVDMFHRDASKVFLA